MCGLLINEDKLRTERIKSLRCSQDILTLAELFSVVFNVTFTLTSEKMQETTTHCTRHAIICPSKVGYTERALSVG